MNRKRLSQLSHDYPHQFWLLAGASFIDMIGNSLPMVRDGRVSNPPWSNPFTNSII